MGRKAVCSRVDHRGGSPEGPLLLCSGWCGKGLAPCRTDDGNEAPLLSSRCHPRRFVVDFCVVNVVGEEGQISSEIKGGSQVICKEGEEGQEEQEMSLFRVFSKSLC